MTDRPSPIPRRARPYQGRPAGVVTRFAAAVVDAAVVLLALVLGYGAVAAVRFMLTPRRFRLPDAAWFFNVTIALAVAVCYLAAGWSLSGRTYGDLVMGLRVIGRTGGAVRPLIAVVRALVCVLFPIGLLWCAVSREQRSLPDLVLRTRVVYDWRPAA